MRQSRAKIESRITALEQGKQAKRPREGKMEDQGHMIRLTGLWQQGDILSGGLSPSAKLVILPNKLKKKSSDPDAVAYLQAPAAGRQEQPKQEKETEQEQLEFWWQK